MLHPSPPRRGSQRTAGRLLRPRARRKGVPVVTLQSARCSSPPQRGAPPPAACRAAGDHTPAVAILYSLYTHWFAFQRAVAPHAWAPSAPRSALTAPRVCAADAARRPCTPCARERAAEFLTRCRALVARAAAPARREGLGRAVCGTERTRRGAAPCHLRPVRQVAAPCLRLAEPAQRPARSRAPRHAATHEAPLPRAVARDAEELPQAQGGQRRGG